MSQVTLQGPLAGAGSAAAVPGSVPGVIADPPPSVTQLASGHLLRGEVIGRNEQGQTLVRTELGTLAVDTKAQLPPGSQVTLQIRTSGAQIQIAVLQVNGHPPHLRGTVPAPSATPPPAGTARAAGPVPPGPAAQPQAGLPGTIANPPASLAGLPSGAQLQGTVLGRDGAGHYLVRTELGTLPLSTDVQLASGNRVILRVASVVPQVQVLVTPAEGQPHAPARAASSAHGPPAAPALAAQATPGPPRPAGAYAALGPHGPGTVDVLAVGQSLRAVVTSPAATAQAAPASSSSLSLAAPEAAAGRLELPAGSVLQIRVVQVSAPTAPASGQPAAPGQIAASIPSAPLGATSAAEAPNPAAPALAPDRPQGIAAPPPPAAPDTVRLEGVVAGRTPSGQPQVQTPAGLLTLEIKAPLPAGTRLVLEFPAQRPAAAAPPVELPGPLEPVSLAYRWPALELALETLQSLDGAETRALLSPQGSATPLPQPGPRLSSAMLFFLNALSGGNPAGWLGELMGGQAARRLEQAGRGELLSRLGGDMAGLSRLAEASVDGWRLLPIPLYDGSQLHQLRLFLRRGDGRAKQPGQDAEATRFVLEVTLTRLGDLQLDGLVRQRRFDLILRSRQSLPPAMRRDITEIFQTANETTGFRGTIAFQDSPDWTPMPIGASATGLVV